MSAPFAVPDWMVAPVPTPTPPRPIDADPHRVEALVNRFIAGKHEALFTAPDAYYRTTGAEAVDGASAIHGRLNALRDMSFSTRRRIRGSALANASRRWYLVSSRTSVQRG